STHIYTPKKYIADLVNIDRGGASQSMGFTTFDANSLRPSKLNKLPQPKTQRTNYDERYVHEPSHQSSQRIPPGKDVSASRSSQLRPGLPSGSNSPPKPSSIRSFVAENSPLPSPSIVSLR
ncbi:hypothetical protein O181_119243, partial [Austropuccinia psidii MF-1]|nr:hypothetical protein [Austropuccinia psidii MF-1]